MGKDFLNARDSGRVPHRRQLEMKKDSNRNSQQVQSLKQKIHLAFHFKARCKSNLETVILESAKVFDS